MFVEYEALIITDPPLPHTPGDGNSDERIVLKGNSKTAREVIMRVTLYQDGYLDFLEPWLVDRATGPPRSSMMDDLIFYWTTHEEPGISKTPLAATIFMQKIIASNYMILLGYLEACLNELETDIRLTHIGKGEKDQALKVVEHWSILQSWSHRFPEYCGAINDILSRRTPPDHPSPPQQWQGCTKDFEAIGNQLSKLWKRTETLSDSFVGLANVAALQASLDEARNIKILTVLGLFFLPLTYIATLFAIPGIEFPHDPAPGQHRGWVYAAIAVPVAVSLPILIWPVLHLFTWVMSPPWMKHH
jgi:hypothetical protein